MAFLSQEKLETDVKRILESFDRTQWTHRVNFNLIKNLPILTREDLRKINMRPDFYASKTSGSTGEPVSIEKTYADYIWYLATNIREMLWRKWDFTKKLAIIKPGSKTEDKNDWGIPKNIVQNQGKSFKIGYEPISILQKWLEEKQPDYLNCPPTIVEQLDLTKLNIIDIKGTGEMGGSMYSSEECGTIAINCPDNPSVKHVMENIICEVDTDGGIIITSLSNPYIKRYKHGDHIELGQCTCGRKLQTITDIKGRVRNMFIMENGDKKWPLFGSRDFYHKYGITKLKAIQTAIGEIELQIISNKLSDFQEEDIKTTINTYIGCVVNATIKYVESFPNYKFEEFVSSINPNAKFIYPGLELSKIFVIICGLVLLGKDFKLNHVSIVNLFKSPKSFPVAYCPFELLKYIEPFS